MSDGHIWSFNDIFLVSEYEMPKGHSSPSPTDTAADPRFCFV